MDMDIVGGHNRGDASRVQDHGPDAQRAGNAARATWPARRRPARRGPQWLGRHTRSRWEQSGRLRAAWAKANAYKNATRIEQEHSAFSTQLFIRRLRSKAVPALALGSRGTALTKSSPFSFPLVTLGSDFCKRTLDLAGKFGEGSGEGRLLGINHHVHRRRQSE